MRLQRKKQSSCEMSSASDSEDEPSVSQQANCNSDLYNDANSDDSDEENVVSGRDSNNNNSKDDDNNNNADRQRQRTRASKVSKLLGEAVQFDGNIAVVEAEQTRIVEKVSSGTGKAKVNTFLLICQNFVSLLNNMQKSFAILILYCWFILMVFVA